MDTSRFTFGKSERLKGKIRIDKLYKEGKSFVAFPFFVMYNKATDESSGNKVLISVAKKRFKNATDRNLIKRRIREAYRTNKQVLKTQHSQIALNYIANKPLDLKTIEKKMLVMFKRLDQMNTQD